NEGALIEASARVVDLKVLCGCGRWAWELQMQNTLCRWMVTHHDDRWRHIGLQRMVTRRIYDGWCHIVGDIWGGYGPRRPNTLELQFPLLISIGNNEIAPAVISYSRRLILRADQAIVVPAERSESRDP